MVKIGAKTLRIYSLITQGTIFSKNFNESSKPINSINFSSSGNEIAFKIGDERLIIYDLITKKEIISISVMTFNEKISSYSFSPSGNEIMVRIGFGYIGARAGYKGVRIYDLKTKEIIFSKDFDPDETIYSLSFSPSGNEIVVEEGIKGFRIYDLKTQELIFSMDFEKSISTLNFSPSGNEIIVKVGDKELRIYKIVGKRR